MHDVVRLCIITDNPARALGYMFECDEADRPAWVRIITEPDLILMIPDGVKCQGLWFNGRKASRAAMAAWRERRRLGGLVSLKDTDWDKIVRFIAGRNKAAQPEIPAEPVDRRPPEPLRDLVLSQRWS